MENARFITVALGPKTHRVEVSGTKTELRMMLNVLFHVLIAKNTFDFEEIYWLLYQADTAVTGE